MGSGEIVVAKSEIGVFKENFNDGRETNTVNTNKKFVCDECNSSFGTRPGLFYHKKSKHDGIRYGCDQCDYKATQLVQLARHKQAKHENIMYCCNQCEYISTNPRCMTRHKESKHLG